MRVRGSGCGPRRVSPQAGTNLYPAVVPRLLAIVGVVLVGDLIEEAKRAARLRSDLEL
jgi:hypothetical protein